LPFPEGSWGQYLSHPGKDDKDEVAKEAEPDYPSCLAIAIDLSKDVTKNIAHGENNYGGRQEEGTKAYHLYGDDIGGD